jgi:hypothetical protein
VVRTVDDPSSVAERIIESMPMGAAKTVIGLVHEIQ